MQKNTKHTSMLTVALTVLFAACTDKGNPVEPNLILDPVDPLVIQLEVDHSSYPDTATFKVRSIISGNPDRCYASGDWQGEKNISGSIETTVGPYPGRTEVVFIDTCTRGSETSADTLEVALERIPLDLPVIWSFGVADSVIADQDSVTILWAFVLGNSLTCTAYGDWSGQKECSGGFETIGPFSGPDTLSFVYEVCNSNGCASDTATVTVKEPWLPVGDFGVALSICDRSTDTCYEGDAALPRPSGPFNNLVRGWSNHGFDMVIFSSYAEENAQNSDVGAMKFKLSDPFIGSSPMENGVVSIANRWPVIDAIDFRRVFEGVLFSSDSSVYVSSCIAMEPLTPDCQEQTLTGLEDNTIQVEFILKDRSGNVIGENGTVERSSSCTSQDPCYFFEYSVTASRGLRSVYVGVAWEACNLSAIGCFGLDELFDRFGNEYIQETLYTQSGAFFPPNSDTAIIELRAFDGIHPPTVERLHLYIEHR